MEAIDEQLVERIDRYVEDLFVREDTILAECLKDTAAAGLPSINVSPNQGKLLYLVARISRASRILELGTLGAYSTIWLARAVPAGGRVITLEVNSHNADVARKNLIRAGCGGRVEVRVGDATATLRQMIATGEPAFDLIFIDADKPRYVDYLHLSLQLAHSGSVILADNLIRNGRVLDAHPEDELVRGVKAFNEAIAAHPRLESIILPIYRSKVDGLSISLVK
ncbi:MAG: O-methyltransferase [Terriglobia bacterium]|nr:MAG: O-methyltransferase [Terriglobia bacterium]